MNATARYALRFETADSTLEAPYHFVSRKAEALKAARQAAKSIIPGSDIVRVWVDDTCTELGVASFDVKPANPFGTMTRRVSRQDVKPCAPTAV